MTILSKEESLVVADMLRFSLEHLTDDFTTDLELYETEITLYRKLIKSHI
jgi:hypothetical protein